MLRNYMCAIAMLAGLAAGAIAYEMRVSRLNTWELDFSSKPPRSIEVYENGAMEEYRYILFQVTNNTSQDVDFYPTFQMETEDGKLYTSIPSPDIAKRLRERFGRELVDTAAISGIMKPGDTRKGVAVFKGVNGTSDVLTVYVGGLSGDLIVEKDAEGKLVPLYRTFKLVYTREGDEYDLAIDQVNRKSAEWVWRG